MSDIKMSDTPSAKWKIEGKEDPFGTTYNCKRSDLGMGDLTDDEMANAVFLYGDKNPSIQQLMDGSVKMGMVYLMAAKDRIRWLSRQNDAKQQEVEALKAAIREILKQHIDCTDTNIFNGGDAIERREVAIESAVKLLNKG